MFINFFIFLLFIFFFFFYCLELNSLTKKQVLEIKQKVNIVNSILTKARSDKSKLNLEKYKESKIVFNAIKKKDWKQANKLAKND